MIYWLLVLATSVAFIAAAALLSIGTAVGERPIHRGCGGARPCDCGGQRDYEPEQPIESGVPDP